MAISRIQCVLAIILFCLYFFFDLIFIQSFFSLLSTFFFFFSFKLHIIKMFDNYTRHTHHMNDSSFFFFLLFHNDFNSDIFIVPYSWKWSITKKKNLEPSTWTYTYTSKDKSFVNPLLFFKLLFFPNHSSSSLWTCYLYLKGIKVCILYMLYKKNNWKRKNKSEFSIEQFANHRWIPIYNRKSKEVEKMIDSNTHTHNWKLTC